jgi:DNA replication and repair protein RecF
MHWLDAVEHETAELAVAVTASRVETVVRLQATLATRMSQSAFPAANIRLDGWMEELVLLRPAVEIEDRYRAVLRDNRARDAAAGRTLEGPHLTDLAVHHAGSDVAAADASTGEQKALLIGLVLAHAGLLAQIAEYVPVLLLDEVTAHLDPSRRHALYAELARLGAQSWMTGADANAFTGLPEGAQVFEVTPGHIRARVASRVY